MKYLLSFLSALAVSACATLPSPVEIESAEIGPYPSNYEALVKAFYAVQLKDPESAMYRGFTQPKRMAIGDRINGAKIGYLVCATVNARNSFGGYTGYKTDAFLIRDEKLVQYIQDAMWFGQRIC